MVERKLCTGTVPWKASGTSMVIFVMLLLSYSGTRLLAKPIFRYGFQRTPEHVAWRVNECLVLWVITFSAVEDGWTLSTTFALAICFVTSQMMYTWQLASVNGYVIN
jgi:hypothetical protein